MIRTIEEIKELPSKLGKEVRFSIIGDRDENSTKIPIWENRFVITDTELLNVIYPEVQFNVLKINNAMKVFEQFYKDTFINQSPLID